MVWIIARQHPGESMAEWFIEGMLKALLDPNHGLSKDLLKKAVFYVVRTYLIHEPKVLPCTATGSLLCRVMLSANLTHDT